MAILNFIRYQTITVLLTIILISTFAECSRHNSNPFNKTVDELAEKSFAINAANQFLNFFFDELENGID